RVFAHTRGRFEPARPGAPGFLRLSGNTRHTAGTRLLRATVCDPDQHRMVECGAVESSTGIARDLMRVVRTTSRDGFGDRAAGAVLVCTHGSFPGTRSLLPVCG